ncbi:MAG: hypothetical protein GEU77_18750 [Deltaproteobacteria bacterium]|nr:hypothetical protein [Deltaproteobacteria bacterium]
MEPPVNTEKLDEHLKEVVHALHGAVSWAMSHQKEPDLVDKAIHDCEEILGVIMEGKVDDWVN